MSYRFPARFVLQKEGKKKDAPFSKILGFFHSFIVVRTALLLPSTATKQ